MNTPSDGLKEMEMVQADSGEPALSEKVNEPPEQEIYGHKTFYSPERGFWHEPLTKAEANELWEAAERERETRAQSMPDTNAAIKAMFEAQQRLKELGWREAQYCPKDGTHFEVIEPGSTGIFDCRYDGEWPDGHYLLFADSDVHCSQPILFRRYPEDEKRYQEKMQKAFAAAQSSG